MSTASLLGKNRAEMLVPWSFLKDVKVPESVSI
ncbi:hypothetical protein VTJ04DRAFT_7463 [Mycothermus thermophilus]